MRNMKVKLMLILAIALMMMLCVNSVAYASEIQKGEFSQKYQEWLKLSDEEKKDTIPPLPINIRGNSKNDNSSNMTRKLFKAPLTKNNDNIPEKYDLREYIDIEVKNQMSASQCWAFAANSSLETFLALHDEDYNFSERHIDYETSSTFIEGPTELSLNRDIKDGGFMGTAFTYYSRGSGPVLEEDMPFKNHENPISQQDLPVERTIKKVDNMIYLPQIYKNYFGEYTDSNNVEYSEETVKSMRDEIKKHIMNNGGITAGIYAPTDEIYYNKDTCAAYMNNSNYTTNHAVTIIGWDDTYSKENFNIQPNKDGAYIVLNSYGEEFGINGVYYISYEDLLVETQMRGFTKVSNINYDNLYQYDTSEMYNYIYSEYAANVFTSSDNEKLTEVMVGSMSLQTCDIYINISNSEDCLNISNASKIASDVELKPGYNTVYINDNIVLEKGQKFSIIVKLQDGYSGIGIEDGTSPFARVISNPGESFISEDGISWNDIYDEDNKMNLSIKAYTQVDDYRGRITDVKYPNKQIFNDVGGDVIVYLKATTKYEGQDVEISIYNNRNKDITSEFNITVPKIENTMSKITVQVPKGMQAGKYTVKAIINSNLIDETEIEIESSEIINDEYIKIYFPDRNLYEALKEENVMPSENVLAYYDDTQEIIINKNIVKLDLEGTFVKTNGYISFGTGYNIEDLTGLDKLEDLQVLILSSNNISTLEPLSNLVNLGRLELYKNKGKIENLDEIRNLTNLRRLEITNSKVKDITALANLTNLRTLDLQYNEITDLAPLSECTELEYLGLDGNPVADISPLKNLNNLRELFIQQSKITDISDIENLTNLSTLYMDINNIEDISYLSNSKKLKTLLIYTNPITDISVLENFTELENLNMSYCNISDISVLKSLTKLKNVEFAFETIEETINDAEQIVEIPKLFQDTFDSTSLAYSEEGIELIDCSWVEEGKTIQLNENCSEGIVRVLKGHAYGSEFKITLDYDEPIEKEISSIQVSTKPNKLEYKIGEQLDLTGGKLLVTYIDESEEEIDLTDKNITVLGYSSDIIGKLNIWIYYKNKMTGLWIEIVENTDKTVKFIQIEEEPTNKVFTQGDEIKFTDGTLTIIYSDDTEAAVSLQDDGVTISNYDSTKLGEQTITINFEGATTELTINVIEKQTEDNYWQFLPYLIAKDSKNGYLENIEQGTTCKDIIDAAYTNGRVEIYKDGELVEDLNEKLATGMIVKVIFTNEEYSYRIVVTGDINGDAEVDELDLLMLARYNAGYEKETQMVVNEYLRAANVHKDEDLGDVLDLLKLARMLVNLD